MPAVRCHGVTRRIDPRPDMPTLLDRALQRDIEQIAAGLHHQTEIAHGGEARLQRRAGIHRAAQRAVGGVVLHPVHRVRQTFRTAGTPDEQVEFHVHQAGQQRDVTEVDLCRIGRHVRRIH